VIRIEAETEVVTVDATTLYPYSFDATLRMQERQDLLHNLELKLGKKHGSLSQDVPVAELDEMVSATHGSRHGSRRSSVFDEHFFLDSATDTDAEKGRRSRMHSGNSVGDAEGSRAATPSGARAGVLSEIDIGISMMDEDLSNDDHKTRPAIVMPRVRTWDQPSPMHDMARSHESKSGIKVSSEITRPDEGYRVSEEGANPTENVTSEKSQQSIRGERTKTVKKAYSLGHSVEMDLNADSTVAHIGVNEGDISLSDQQAAGTGSGAGMEGKEGTPPQGSVSSPRSRSRFKVSSPKNSPEHGPIPAPSDAYNMWQLQEEERRVRKQPSTLDTRYHQYRELNKHIRYLQKTSKRSSLVILNLPDPNEEESAVDYMQFIQILTEGCPRVMLVHGTGHEVISGFNAVVDDLEAHDGDGSDDEEDGSGIHEEPAMRDSTGDEVDQGSPISRANASPMKGEKV